MSTGSNSVSKMKKDSKKQIQFDIVLTPDQLVVYNDLPSNAITTLRGSAGSGKTLLAVRYALEQIFLKEKYKMYITRPTVSDEEIGFLPGSLNEKMDPWVQPIFHNINMCYSKTERQRKTVQTLIEDKIVEIVPIAYMRGRTLTNSIIIVDEAQNITKKQMEMVIGRLGQNSQMIICGDMRQVDLKGRMKSGLDILVNLGQGIRGFRDYTLTSNHRHSILDELLDKFESYDVQQENEANGKYKIEVKKTKTKNIFEDDYETEDGVEYEIDENE